MFCVSSLLSSFHLHSLPYQAYEVDWPDKYLRIPRGHYIQSLKRIELQRLLGLDQNEVSWRSLFLVWQEYHNIWEILNHLLRFFFISKRHLVWYHLRICLRTHHCPIKIFFQLMYLFQLKPPGGTRICLRTHHCLIKILFQPLYLFQLKPPGRTRTCASAWGCFVCVCIFCIGLSSHIRGFLPKQFSFQRTIEKNILSSTSRHSASP